jgi:hypothetical protein
MVHPVPVKWTGRPKFKDKMRLLTETYNNQIQYDGWQEPAMLAHY